MIQVYADSQLVYDNRLEDYDLIGLTATSAVNKGGTAEIKMPVGHPAYAAFASYKTVVEIQRDGRLPFRGRVLYPMDDFQGARTIVCEGELCFFQDAVSRPYLYQDSPEVIFSALVSVYNDQQLDENKRFKVGTITVTDANNYIRLESESAESVLDTLNKLLERCGGYIVFTTDSDGARVINWYAVLNYSNNQTIEFGENLLDFSRTGANTALATAILPYGAKDGETGERVNIVSVNDGQDYIQDDEAVAARGFIIKPVSFDDVTEPANLLRKAQEWLEKNRYIVTTLQLSALDLSYLDKDFDSFRVGDNIRVKSAPHGVDEDFLLVERTEDFLHPENSMIILGKDVNTLTDADVAGDNQNRDEMHKVTHEIKSDYQTNISQAVEETERTLTSLIEQTSESIMLEVSQTYTTNDQLEEAITSRMTQLEDQFIFEFESLKVTVDENDAEARQQIEEIYKYIKFDNGDIILGAGDSAITLTLKHDIIVFKKNGAQFGWWDGVDFHTGNIVVQVNERAQFGNFAFVPRSNGSLSFLKVDDGGWDDRVISLSVNYTGGVVLLGTDLDDLEGLTVTALYGNGETQVVTDYELSGAITDTTNVIEVAYGGKTATFTVNARAAAGYELEAVDQAILGYVLTSNAMGMTIYYADEVELVDNAVALVDEQSTTIWRTTSANYASNDYNLLKGKYARMTSGDIYYIPEDATHFQNVKPSTFVLENFGYTPAFKVVVV